MIQLYFHRKYSLILCIIMNITTYDNLLYIVYTMYSYKHILIIS